MFKMYCLLLLTILYQIYQTDSIDTFGSQLITKEGMLDKSIFNNSAIAYLETNLSIVLQPKRLLLQGINEVYFYKINSLYDGNLNWDLLGKSEVVSYYGETIENHVTYVENNVGTSYYALYFAGDLTEIEIEFLFINTECRSTFKVGNRPKILYPGQSTKEIFKYNQKQRINESCHFNIISNNTNYIVNMTSQYYYNHKTFDEILTVDGKDYNSRRMKYFLVEKKNNSILEYNAHDRSNNDKIGFIIHFKPVFGDLRITYDGSIQIQMNHTWYYLQHGSLDGYDAEALCIGSGNASVSEMKSRPARPNELLLHHNYDCSPDARSLHYCTQIDASRLYFKYHYHMQERVEQIICTKTRLVRKLSTLVQMKFFNEWYYVANVGVDKAGALLLCETFGYDTLLEFGLTFATPVGKCIVDFQCPRTKIIKDCFHSFNIDCRYLLRLKCSNNVGVLKIVPGYHNKGLIQIGSNSICLDSFTKINADIICKSLGYIDAFKFWGNESFLQQIKMTCYRSHTSFEYCFYDFNAPCKSSLSVHILCQNIRLVDKTKNEGRIQLIYMNKIGYLCHDNFTIVSAHTICKQIGFKKALLYYTGHAVTQMYGYYSEDYLLNNLICNSDDTDINTCSHGNWSTDACRGSHYATGVKCLEKGYCNSQTASFNIRNHNGTKRYNVHSSIVNILPRSANDWCTGVFIEEQWILTSANCFSLDSDSYNIFINPNFSEKYFEIYKYPSYNGQTGYDNLALMKVYHNLNVTPICIHNDAQTLLNSINSFGWKETKFLGWKNYKLYSRMTSLFSSAACAENTGLSSQRMANLFCSPNVANPSNGFYGQSGGPLFGRYNNKDVLLGITNRAIKAARPFNNMIFTNIYKYKNWISSIIKNN